MRKTAPTLVEYGRWCHENGLPPLPPAQIGLALAELFESAGISIAERDGRLIVVGVSIKDQPETLTLEPSRQVAVDNTARGARLQAAQATA